MSLVGMGIWAIVILLLILDAAVMVAVAQHIEGFGWPLPWRLSASAVALLAITIAGIWAGGPNLAMSPGLRAMASGQGFPPGWSCPNLISPGAMVCFADGPVTLLQQSGARPAETEADAATNH
jgi:hypothetical protein